MVRAIKESIIGLMASIIVLLVGSAMKSASAELSDPSKVLLTLGTAVEFLGVLMLSLAVVVLSLSVFDKLSEFTRERNSIKRRRSTKIPRS